MEKLLRQDEIDALFRAARDGAQTRTKAPVSKHVTPYSFSVAGNVSTAQLRAVSAVNDLFARNLTHHLTGWLRARFQVNPVSIEQIAFNEFLLRLPELGYLASMRLEPLRAPAVLQLDLGLAAPMIDLLLGGAGRQGPLRDLTEIEESILASVVQVICRELSSAWEAVELHFLFERRQMQAQAARVLPAGERTLCISFEVRTQGCSGLLSLALQAVALNAALRRLAGERAGNRHAAESRARMETLVRRICFGASLQLPAVRLPAGTLEALEPGTVVSLKLPATTRSEWRVGGSCLGHAWAVRHNGRRAARLETIAEKDEELSVSEAGVAKAGAL